MQTKNNTATQQAHCEVMITDLCAQEEWLAQNKETAPYPEVRKAKNELIRSLFRYNTTLNQYSNQ